MHLNASKYMQNELRKSFVHEIIKEVVSITHKQIKIDNFPSKDSTFCSKQLLALKYKKSKWAYSEKKNRKYFWRVYLNLANSRISETSVTSGLRKSFAVPPHIIVTIFVLAFGTKKFGQKLSGHTISMHLKPILMKIHDDWPHF